MKSKQQQQQQAPRKNNTNGAPPRKRKGEEEGEEERGRLSCVTYPELVRNIDLVRAVSTTGPNGKVTELDAAEMKELRFKCKLIALEEQVTNMVAERETERKRGLALEAELAAMRTKVEKHCEKSTKSLRAAQAELEASKKTVLHLRRQLAQAEGQECAPEQAERLVQLERENEELLRARRCPVCVEAHSDTHPLCCMPCGHLVCLVCLPAMKRLCPTCRLPFRKTVRVFL